jgi:D-sedoheptulose 7-phosphate isomerase
VTLERLSHRRLTVPIMGKRESQEKQMIEEPVASYRDELGQYYSGLSAAIAALPIERIAEVAELLFDCYRRGGTIFPIGNGGSAATASHFACDLSKGTHLPGSPRIRVVALTDNVPLITAWANDKNYACVFAEQLEALVRKDDVVLLISASGNSPNVLAAAAAGRAAGAHTVAFTGPTGGKVAPMVDIAIPIGIEGMEPIEDGHLILCHSICVSLRARVREFAAGAS